MAFHRFDRSIGKLTRRRAIRGFSLATAGLAVASQLGGGETEARQQRGGATPIGAASNARNAIEFVGRLEQKAFDFEFLGYLSFLAGFDPDQLFTNGNPTRHQLRHARFGIVARLEGLARSTLDTLFVVTAGGDVRFFYNPAGGSDHDEPDTFTTGSLIASGSISVQNTIDVTGPREGRASGWGDIGFENVVPFASNGRQYRLGQRGQRLRLAFTGSGELLDPDVPHSLITLAGNGVSLPARTR